ncbi:MAG TPA: hypothetical protein ENH47_01270, partial [Ignavibacteriales bacterium]|nr:hypothetical protein [Ignavibacteriales bacterium]
FLIYKIKDGKVVDKELKKNNFTNHGHGPGNHEHGYEHHGHNGRGHGHGHNRLIEGLGDCKYLIFKSGGWRIIDDLEVNGIHPIITDVKFADDAIDKFIKGELEELELEDCHGNGQGHGRHH